MTNLEKYKAQLLGLAQQNLGAGLYDGKLISCEKIPCCRCDFRMYGEGSNCQARFINWLYKEAKE